MTVDHPIRLSVCIPTYNRAAFIAETLESVLSQTNGAVEVVVVDGASTDETADVITSFQRRFANLVYHRGQCNMGVDKDMATAVDLARGEYCWLMSSDDLVKPGAISKMVDEINSGADIYLCNVTLCSSAMRPIRDTKFLSDLRSGDLFDLGNRKQFLTYLNLAASNNALFCYMSSIAFRRACWLAVDYNERFTNTGYAHVFRLFSFIKKRCLVKYVPSALVLNRSGNDSFSSQGIEKRYMLDFDGYLLLANELFGLDPQIKSEFLRVMTREHPWYRLIKLRSAVRSSAVWRDISSKLLIFGYSRRALAICGFLGRFRSLVNVAVFVNTRFASAFVVRWLRVRL
jgi:abequosyltransferase